MSVCIYLYIDMYIYSVSICICIHVFFGEYQDVSKYVYIYVYVCAYICMRVHPLRDALHNSCNLTLEAF